MNEQNDPNTNDAGMIDDEVSLEELQAVIGGGCTDDGGGKSGGDKGGSGQTGQPGT